MVVGCAVSLGFLADGVSKKSLNMMKAWRFRSREVHRDASPVLQRDFLAVPLASIEMPAICISFLLDYFMSNSLTLSLLYIFNYQI